MSLLLTNYSQYFSENTKSGNNPRCQMEKGREHSHEISLNPGDFSLEMLRFPIADIDSVFVFTHYSIFVLRFTPCSSKCTLHVLIDKSVQKDGQKTWRLRLKLACCTYCLICFRNILNYLSLCLCLSVSLCLCLSLCLSISISLSHTYRQTHTT